MKPSNPDKELQAIRDRIIGLGERSFHKSYYPQLRQNLDRLERFRALLDHTSDFVILLALPEGLVADANAALGRLLGEPAETLIGRSFVSLGIEEAPAILETLQREMPVPPGGGESSSCSMVVEFGQPDARVWLELAYSVAVLDGRSYGILVGRDVTERRRNEAMVASLLAEKEALLDNALVGIVMVRDRLIVSCNRRFEEMFGYGPQGMLGMSMRVIYPDDEVFALVGEQAYGALASNSSFSGSIELSRTDGSLFWAEVTGRALDHARPHAGSVWIITDISERKAAEERAVYLAYYDVLTGLPNRSLVHDRMRQAAVAADRSATKIAVLMVDLDRFKTINDSLGHSVGDRLLVELAKRLKGGCGKAIPSAGRAGTSF